MRYGYASNLEVAEHIGKIKSDEPYKEYEKVHTPNAKTIEEVAAFKSRCTNIC